MVWSCLGGKVLVQIGILLEEFEGFLASRRPVPNLVFLDKVKEWSDNIRAVVNEPLVIIHES